MTLLLAALAALVVGLATGAVAVVLVGRRSGPADRARLARASSRADPGPVPAPEATLPLEAVLHSLPLGVVVVDAGGTVRYRNAVAARFTAGRHGDALVAAAVRELVAAGGRAAVRTVDLYGPPRRQLVVRAGPLDGDAAGTSLITVEDVTDQHRVDAVRRDFVANVSHELKTPVGAIGVLAEALEGQDDPLVVARLAGRLQAEAMRLGHTVDDLLALSRIESGELSDPVEVDLDDVADAAVERLASAAEGRDVTLAVCRADQPVAVVGDRRQLVSAVTNLVDNAVKYSDPGSEVVLRLRREPGRAGIEVVDTGVGIPESDLERIFERFYRVDPARSRHTGGTGLGLSIVRHVALNHGGEVTVRSTEGRGSRFGFWVPAPDPAPDEPPTQE